MASRTFYLYTPIPTLNKYIAINRRPGRGRFAANKEKQTCETALVVELIEQGARRVGDCVNLAYDWFCPNRRTDKDNIMFGQKFVQDALQKADVIPADGWRNINQIQHNFFIKGTPRLQLTVTEAICQD